MHGVSAAYGVSIRELAGRPRQIVATSDNDEPAPVIVETADDGLTQLHAQVLFNNLYE